MDQSYNGSDLISGSPIVPAPGSGSSTPAGQTPTTGGDKDYDELLRKFGEQGRELGEFRTFVQNINPLLEKLDESPELIQAITDGHLSQDLVKAILENRVSVGDAEAIQGQAEKEVKKEVGKKAFSAPSNVEDVQKLVEKKVGELRQEIEEKSEMDAFQDYTLDFIARTADFPKYAEAVEAWIDKHDIADVEVAYYAIKGQMSEANAKKAADVSASDRAKEFVMNAAGGGVHATHTQDGTPLVDQLIAGKPNPNSFF